VVERMRGAVRSTARLALGLAAVLASGAGTPLPGQEPPAARVEIEVQVIQVAGSTFYVSAGRDRGLVPGDTLRVYRAGDDVRLGRLVVIAVAESGASLGFAGAPFAVTRGDLLRLEGGAATAAGLEAGGDAPVDPAAADLPGLPGVPADPGRAGGRGAIPGGSAERSGVPVIHGSAGVEVDAYLARSRWGGPGVAAVEQAVTTPALRFQAVAAGLPLGLEARANVRAAYRATDEAAYGPSRSIRVYEASVIRRFERVPLEVRAGRFWNRSSSLRSFWDGGSVRVGRRFGVGAAAGYEPARGDEGFSTDVEKWSAFADYHYRGVRASYTADLTLLDERSTVDDWTRRTLGWSQRARWRGVFLSHRLELDLDPADGAERLRRAFADVTVPVAGGVRLEGSYARESLHWWLPVPPDPGSGAAAPVLERWSAGASWAGTRATLSARGGRLREGDGRAATSLDGSLFLRGWGRAGWVAGVTGVYWDDGEFRSLFVSPSVSRAFGSANVRVGYQYYGVDGDEPRSLHGLDAALDLPLRDRLSLRLSAQGQAGDGLATVRSFTSLRMAF
jgi:hypothetical protein